MARIRTVKPELFRHESLFELEQESGLPIRLAFIALFSVCDKSGRFKWRPRQLKLDCMPYDEFEFSRVLDALTTRGFVVKYENSGEIYGCIPTFINHQIINNRETPSLIPDHEDQFSYVIEVNEESTRQPRVSHASATRLNQDQGEREREREREGEGEGEGKGREGKGNTSVRKKENYPPEFESAWSLYPARAGDNPKKKAFQAWTARIKSGVDVQRMIDGVSRYRNYCEKTGKIGTEVVKHAATFFGPDCPFLETWLAPLSKPEALIQKNLQAATKFLEENYD